MHDAFDELLAGIAEVSKTDKQALLDRMVVVLKEHFDSVQLVGTALEPSGVTSCYASGAGCWYSRTGATRDWLEGQTAETYVLEEEDD